MIAGKDVKNIFFIIKISDIAMMPKAIAAIVNGRWPIMINGIKIARATMAVITRVFKISTYLLIFQATKSAVTLLKFNDRFFQQVTVKIRPVFFHKYKFAVRHLPEHEITQAFFTTGTD